MLSEIQKYDYDRYLTLLFSEKEKRADIMALISFSLEVARIRSRVTEPMMGHIRLQWWRDALDELYDPARTLRRHEVALALQPVVRRYGIDKNDLLQIIDAREKDLEDEPFANIEDFLQYANATSYPLNKAILEALNCNETNIYSATQHLSTAWALCAILRSAHRNFSSRRNIFPQSLMKENDISTTDFGSDRFLPALKNVVKNIYDIAEAELATAKTILRSSPKAEIKKARPVLLNIITVQNHLKQIRKNNYDIFTRPLNPYLRLGSLLKIYIR